MVPWRSLRYASALDGTERSRGFLESLFDDRAIGSTW
jgi:hypothetical protein